MMFSQINEDLYGNYRNLSFSQIWPAQVRIVNDQGKYEYIDNIDLFIKDYEMCGIPMTISKETATTLFYLLYAAYGNSTIASDDKFQFGYKLFSTIFMYGPTWEKRLEIQKAIRELDLETVKKGGMAIYNTALNPNQPVVGGQGAAIGSGTNTLEELTYINQQNTTNYKKSDIDAYTVLIELLETDVTKDFIDKFKKLFLTVVSPELPLWYIDKTGEPIEYVGLFNKIEGTVVI